jgi:phosphoribosylamine--glycine ligase
MMTSAGPKVIEFNARFGDPEAQVVLPRLESDLAELLIALLDGEKPEPVWSEEAVLGVVAASKGYPGSYEKNHTIQQVPKSPLLFFAGVEKKNGVYVNSGGRVLLLSEKAATLGEAKKQVYEKMKELDTGNLFYRTDIGFRALK